MANSNVWTREWLRGQGVDDSRIGYNQTDPNSPYVTVDGKYFITPGSESGGKSYADINALRGAWSQFGADKSYTPQYGQQLQNTVQGLQNYPAYQAPAYSAQYAGQLQNALNGVQSYPSYQAPAPYQAKYGEKVQELLDGVENAEFSYDHTTDPSYKAYADAYARQGSAAAGQALATTAASTGGIASSYASAAANQMQQAYAKKAADIIPQLEQQAYGRFSDEQYRNLNVAGMYNAIDQQGMSQYNADRAFDYGVYQDGYGRAVDMASMYAQLDAQDRTNYENDRNFGYGVYSDQYARTQDLASLYAGLEEQSYGRFADQRNYDYGRTRDTVADSQWREQMDTANSQWQQQLNLAAQQNMQSAAYTGGVGNGGGDTASPFENATPQQIANYSEIVSGLSQRNPLENLAWMEKNPQLYTSTVGQELYDYLLDEVRASASAAEQAQGAAAGGVQKPVLTFEQVEAAVKENNLTPNVLSAYQYYYGAPHKSVYATSANQNGDGWIYVSGFGRLTASELQKKVDSGEIVETYDAGKNMFAYRKRSSKTGIAADEAELYSPFAR